MAERTPRRKSTPECDDDFEDPYKLSRGYKTPKEVALEEAAEKLRGRKKLKKVRRSLIRKEPKYEMTEYEKWQADPDLYEREQKKKLLLKKKTLKKKRHLRRLNLNKKFLQELDFQFLGPISPRLTLAYHKRLHRKAKREFQKIIRSVKLMRSVDPNKPLRMKRMKRCMRIAGISSSPSKKKKKNANAKINRQIDIYTVVAESNKPIPFDKILEMQDTGMCTLAKKKVKKSKSKRQPKKEQKDRKRTACGGGDQCKASVCKRKCKQAKTKPMQYNLTELSSCDVQKDKLKKRKQKKLKKLPNRDIMTQKQYDKFLAIPRRLPKPPKEKRKKKQTKNEMFGDCSTRLEQLSRPNKRLAYETLKLYKNTLPMESIVCLENIIREPPDSIKRPDVKTAERVFDKIEKRIEREEKARRHKALCCYRKWLNYEVALLTDAMFMMMSKASPKRFGHYRMQISAKVFEVARRDYKLKIKKPNRKTKNLRKQFYLNVADVIAAWIDVTVEKGQALMPKPWYPKRTGKPKKRVQLPSSVIFSARSFSSSLSYWSESITEESGIEESVFIEAMIKGKYETLIETIVRILKAGDTKDLEYIIHQHLIPKNTYKDLLSILQDMIAKKLTLEDKSEPPDIVDKEMEENLMTWAFTHRESHIGIHEQEAITKFSRHIMDLFNIDKTPYLIAEGKKHSAPKQKLTTIHEGEGESRMEIDTYNLFFAQKLKYKHSEDSEEEAQYVESQYGIAGDLSDKEEEEGEGEKALSEEGEEIPLFEEGDERPLSEEGEERPLSEEGEERPLSEEKPLSEEGEEGEENPDWGEEGEEKPDWAEEGEEKPDWGEEGEEKPDWGEEILIPEQEVVESEFEPEYIGSAVDLLHYPTGHPSSIHEHSDSTVCCITIRKYAEWVYTQSVFLAKWNDMYRKCIKALREFEDHKIKYGVTKGAREQFLKLEERIHQVMDILKQYRNYIELQGEGVFESFKGKEVVCCAKCLEENRLPEMDDDPAHDQMNALIRSIQGMKKWNQLLENIVDPEDIIKGLNKTVKYMDNKQQQQNQNKSRKKEEPKLVDVYEIEELSLGSSDETLYVHIEEL